MTRSRGKLVGVALLAVLLSGVAFFVLRDELGAKSGDGDQGREVEPLRVIDPIPAREGGERDEVPAVAFAPQKEAPSAEKSTLILRGRTTSLDDLGLPGARVIAVLQSCTRFTGPEEMHLDFESLLPQLAGGGIDSAVATISGADGEFSIPVNPEQVRFLYVRHPHHGVATLGQPIPDPCVVRVPTGLVIAGSVTEHGRGTPISDATVSLYLAGRAMPIAFTQSGADGTFRVATWSTDAKSTLSIQKDGFEPNNLVLSSSAPGVIPIVISLVPIAAKHWIMVDGNGVPWTNAAVESILAEPPELRWTIMSHPPASFSLDAQLSPGQRVHELIGVASDQGEIRVSTKNPTAARSHRLIACWHRSTLVGVSEFDSKLERIRIDIEPPKTKTVAFTVLPHEGRAQRVQATGWIHGQYSMLASTAIFSESAEDGRFVIRLPMPLSRFVLGLRSAGSEPEYREFSPDQIDGLEIRLSAAGEPLRSTIQDSQGHPIEGAVILGWSKGRPNASDSPARSERDGTFQLAIPKQPVSVLILKEKFAPRHFSVPFGGSLPEKIILDPAKSVQIEDIPSEEAYYCVFRDSAQSILSDESWLGVSRNGRRTTISDGVPEGTSVIELIGCSTGRVLKAIPPGQSPR